MYNLLSLVKCKFVFSKLTFECIQYICLSTYHNLPSQFNLTCEKRGSQNEKIQEISAKLFGERENYNNWAPK